MKNALPETIKSMLHILPIVFSPSANDLTNSSVQFYFETV
jgi:hypothetical protein